MQRILRVLACLVVACFFAVTAVSANDDELTLRNRQLVITSVTPNCEAGPGANTLLVEGRNIGGNAPHVTLGLREVTAGAPSAPDPITGNQIFTVSWNPATVFDFCGNPASYLLTVLRTMNHPKHRNLQPNRNDLDVFDVAIATEADADGITQEQLDQAIADHATSPPHLSPNDTDGVAATQGVIAGEVNAVVNAHTTSVPHLSSNDTDGVAATQGIIAGEIGAVVNAHGTSVPHLSPNDTDGFSATQGIIAAEISAFVNVHALSVPHLSLNDTDGSAATQGIITGEVNALISNHNTDLNAHGGGGGIMNEKTFHAAALCPPGSLGLVALGLVLWDTSHTLGANNPGANCNSPRAQRGGATFPDGATYRMAKTVQLPADWDQTVSVVLYWTQIALAAGNNVRWRLETKCTGPGDVNPAFNVEDMDPDVPLVQDLDLPVPGIVNALAVSPSKSLAAAGCAPGDLLTLQISRLGADAADTFAQGADVFGVEVTVGR